jgi:hypothetical protein
MGRFLLHRLHLLHLLDHLLLCLHDLAQHFGLSYFDTWVPLGPHRLGSRSSLTSRSGLPEDMPTY